MRIRRTMALTGVLSALLLAMAGTTAADASTAVTHVSTTTTARTPPDTAAAARGGVAATAPVTLGAAYVLDEPDVLDASDESAANARLSDLSTTGVDLYVAIVDTFTDPSGSEDWANRVARENGLGPKQYLLAIATQSRQFYLSADSDGPLDASQVAAIESAITPTLRSGDYLGAITTAADQMRSDVHHGGGSLLTIILILVVIIVAIVLVVVLLRRVRHRKAVTGPPAGAAAASELEGLHTTELARRAGSALVAADDAVKTSEQEVEFARAQFGDQATVEFQAALAQAKANLDQAFELKQKLDDAVPDTEAQTRAWNIRIVQLCASAEQGLDDKAAAFDELRKLEQNAPEALAGVQQARTEAAAGLDAAARRLQSLRAAYSPEALAAVADNVDQAGQRLAFADARLAEAQTAIGAGDGGRAAVGIRAAEEAVAQAQLLDNAIDRLGADLAEAEKRAAALVQELEADVAAARTMPDADGRLAAVIAAVQHQLQTARTELASAQKRPLATLQALTAVDQQLDGYVKAQRDAQQQAERSRQLLGQLLMQAQAQVSAAEDYITARRGAIGPEARTRVAQAGAELARARQLQTTDPDAALRHAQRADELAAASQQHAQDDVGAFQGGMLGGRGSAGGMLGAVLGGIVIDSLLSGGGIFGGGMPGGGTPGGVFGGGGPGSFGGGGTRSRRGGGHF